MLNGIILLGLLACAGGACLVAWDFIAGFIAGARAEWYGTTLTESLVRHATPRSGLGVALMTAGGMVSLLAWLAKAVFT